MARKKNNEPKLLEDYNVINPRNVRCPVVILATFCITSRKPADAVAFETWVALKNTRDT